jgi:hypothetical protein
MKGTGREMRPSKRLIRDSLFIYLFIYLFIAIFSEDNIQIIYQLIRHLPNTDRPFRLHSSIYRIFSVLFRSFPSSHQFQSASSVFRLSFFYTGVIMSTTSLIDKASDDSSRTEDIDDNGREKGNKAKPATKGIHNVVRLCVGYRTIYL